MEERRQLAETALGTRVKNFAKWSFASKNPKAELFIYRCTMKQMKSSQRRESVEGKPRRNCLQRSAEREKRGRNMSRNVGNSAELWRYYLDGHGARRGLVKAKDPRCEIADKCAQDVKQQHRDLQAEHRVSLPEHTRSETGSLHLQGEASIQNRSTDLCHGRCHLTARVCVSVDESGARWRCLLSYQEHSGEDANDRCEGENGLDELRREAVECHAGQDWRQYHLQQRCGQCRRQLRVHQ